MKTFICSMCSRETMDAGYYKNTDRARCRPCYIRIALSTEVISTLNDENEQCVSLQLKSPTDAPLSTLQHVRG